MTAVVTSNAQRIFNVIDDELGFFKRSSETPFSKPQEEAFYEKKKQEMIDYLEDKDNLNSAFWFQGYGIMSGAELRVNTTEGVHLVPTASHPSKEEVQRLYKVNETLKSLSSFEW